MSVLLMSAIDVAIVIAIGLLIAGVVCRRRSAALRHRVLATAVICALVVPALELAPPMWELPILSSPTLAETSVGSTSAIETVGLPQASTGNGVGARVNWFLWAFTLWMAGVIVGFAILATGLVRLRRVARSAEVVVDDQIGAVLLYSSHPSLVVTWGVWRPKVLLPVTAREWSDERRRVVLAHELAHVRRDDWRMQMMASLLVCLHWFNPLVWMAYRRLRLESERACDDAVLNSGMNGPDYATHLVALAEEAGRLRHSWTTATAIAHSSTLEERIHAMLKTDLNRDPITGFTRRAITVGLLALTVVIAAAGLSARTASEIAAPPPQAMQSGSASIAGVLYDQHSGLLPGVAVTLTQNATGGSSSVESDRTGSFVFRDLAPGDYTVVTRLAGFAPVRNVITVTDGENVQRNILLPLGSVQETVTVATDGSPSGPMVVARTSRTIPEPRIATPCVGRIGGCIKTPRKLLDVKPAYPSSLAAARAEGRVVLVGRIGLDGYMSDLRIADPPNGQTAPHQEFVAAAWEAVRRWEFEPTYLNGAPVEANITVTVVFAVR